MASCPILKDPATGKILKVNAPNGKPSLLYRKALDAFGQDSVKALRAWAVVYTPTFKLRHGDWEIGESSISLDENGEPNSDVVFYDLPQINKILTTTFARWNEFQPGQDGWQPIAKINRFKAMLASRYPDLQVEVMTNYSMPGMGKLVYKSSIKSFATKFTPEEINKQKDKVNVVMDYLMAKFPDVTYEWVKASSLNQKEHYRPIGSIRSYVKNNKIYLVEGKVTPEDGIEEISHVLIELLRQSRPQLFKGLFDNTVADPRFELDYINIRQWYGESSLNRSLSPAQLDILVKSEFLAKILGKSLKAEMALNPEGRPTSAFGKLLQRFLDWLASIFNTNAVAPGQMIKEMAAFVNTKETIIPSPMENYMFYSIDPPVEFEDRDEMEKLDPKRRGRTAKELNLEESRKQLLKLKEVREFVATAPITEIKRKTNQLEVIDKFIANMEFKIEALEQDRATISVTKYKGSEDFEIKNNKVTEVGANFGNFFHYMLEEIQADYVKTGKTPSVIYSKQEWFNKYYEKYKYLINFENPDLEMLRDIGTELIANMDSLLREGSILLPEISIGVEDVGGTIVLGRLDVMAVNKNGEVEIIDLKTKKTNLAVGPKTFPTSTFTAVKYVSNEFKDGVAPAFAEIKQRSAIAEYQMQMSIYSEMLRKMGIKVKGRTIWAVAYKTEGNGDTTMTSDKFWLRGYSVATFVDSDFYVNDSAGTIATGNIIDKAAQSRFRSEEEIEEEVIEEQTKENPFANLDSDTQDRMIQKLDELADKQITELDKEIKAIDANANITQEDKNERVDRLRKRMAGLVSVRSKIKNERTGETPEAIALGKAMIIKAALDTFNIEIGNIGERVNEINIPRTYEIGTPEHNKALRELQGYTETLDDIAKYIGLIESTIRSMSIEPEVKEVLVNYLGAMTSRIANITDKNINISKNVIKAIIMKTIGKSKWQSVFGDMRKVLSPKLDWINNLINSIETGQVNEENMGYKLRRMVRNMFNLNSPNRLESLKAERDRIQQIINTGELTDKTIDDYLDGIINSPNSAFYMGSTISGNPSIVDVSSIIGSNADSELIINSMFQYMRNVTEEARMEALRWADELEIDKFKNDFINSAGGIQEANKMVSEEVDQALTYDEDGNVLTTEKVRQYTDILDQSFYTKHDSYKYMLRELSKEIKDINKQINDAPTSQEKETLRNARKQLLTKQEETSLAFVTWLIENTKTKVKPEILLLMRGSGYYNDQVTDYYNEINSIILAAGGEENLDEDMQDRIDYLESEISRLKQELINQQPELAQTMDQLIDNFQFELNYNLWVRKREEVVKNGNTVQLQRWDKNNSDLAPTEDWQNSVNNLYEQMAQVADQDPVIKDLNEQKRKLKAKVKVRGRFNYRYLNEQDISEYERIEAALEERRTQLSEDTSLGLTKEQRQQLRILGTRLDSLRKKIPNQDYTKRIKDMRQAVIKAYDEVVRLTKERDESGSVSRDLLDRLDVATAQYQRQEQIFADFFNKHNSKKYIVGQDNIAKGKQLPESLNTYMFEYVPVNPDDMELVPNKKYRYKRLKSEAYNPDYQESFVKQRFGAGFYPYPKGVSFNKQTNKFEISRGAKFVNPKFLQLQQNTTAYDFYNKWIVDNFLTKQSLASGKPLGFRFPFVQQLGFENVMSKGLSGVAREMKEKGQEIMYGNSEFERASNESGLLGTQRVMFKENYAMPADLTTTNGIEAIVNWNAGLYLNQKMATISVEMSAVLNYLNNIIGRLDPKTDQDKITKVKTIIEQIDYNRKKFIYGQVFETGDATAKLFNRKNARVLMQIASFGRMAFDLPMQLGNMFAGNVQAFYSTGDFRHATESDYFAAKRLLYTRWLPKLLADYGKISDASFETKLFRYINPTSKDLNRLFDANTVGKMRRIANRVFNVGDLSMALQDKGEVEIGMTTMLMIMHNRKYEVYQTDEQGNVIIEDGIKQVKKDESGNTVYVNGLEAFTLVNNSIALRNDVNISQNDIFDLKGTIMTEVYRFQGNYSTYTKSKFGSTLLGTLFEYYRKYLIPAVSARFSYGGFEGVGSAYSWDSSEAYTGFYVAAGKMFKYYGWGRATKTLLYDTLLPGFVKKSINYDTGVNEYYRSRAAMAGREMLGALLFLILFETLRSKIMDGDDDDLSYTELMLLRSVIKVTNEARSMVPVPIIGKPGDYIRSFGQFTSAFKEGETLWNMAENAFFYADYTFTGNTYSYERGFYQRDTDKFLEGDPKIMKNLYDLLGISNIIDIFEPYQAAKTAVKNR